jgi:hypothetical protein
MTSRAIDGGGHGAWLYCVCADIDEAAIDHALLGVVGVAGETPRAVAVGALRAIVGSVDLARFGEEGLRHRLNDLDRLEAMARAHHGVVERVGELGPVAPTRLATVYDDDDGVTAMLRQHGDELVASLARVHGRQEWGVKAFATSAPPTAASSRPDARAESGAAYLRRRQESLSASQAAGAAAFAAADALHVRLSATAPAARRHRPQDPRLRGDDRRMVLNAAYLLPDGHADAFANLVAAAALEHPQLSVSVTGPWPPYSFTVTQD